MLATLNKSITCSGTNPDFDERMFAAHDWTDLYRDVEELAPKARGKSLSSTHTFGDAYHAGNTVTRRSQTGVLLFLSTPSAHHYLLYSKRQNTVETSTFGSEFTAQRTLVELVVPLRYKLYECLVSLLTSAPALNKKDNSIGPSVSRGSSGIAYNTHCKKEGT